MTGSKENFLTVSDSDIGTFMWEPPEIVKALVAGLTPEKREKVLHQIKNVAFCFAELITGVVMKSAQQTTLMAIMLTENVDRLEREMGSPQLLAGARFLPRDRLLFLTLRLRLVILRAYADNNHSPKNN